MNRPVLIALLLALLLSAPAFAKDAKKKPATAKPAAATKEALKKALDTFRKEFREVDLDLRIEAIEKLSKAENESR